MNRYTAYTLKVQTNAMLDVINVENAELMARRKSIASSLELSKSRGEYADKQKELAMTKGSAKLLKEIESYNTVFAKLVDALSILEEHPC